MDSFLIKNFNLPVSLCDNDGKLSIWGTFSLFGDIASEHGTFLNVGKDELAKNNCIWVISKTVINIHSRPKTLQDISLKTWPSPAGKIRCNRYYTITADGEIAVEGKSEWAVINVENNKPQKVIEIYPKDMIFLQETVCEIPFNRYNEDFSNAEICGEYVVRSTDIDTSQHMNNVAYIRAVSGIFKKLAILPENITNVEIAYKLQCYENEKLTFKYRTNENGYEIGIIKDDGTTATIICINI